MYLPVTTIVGRLTDFRPWSRLQATQHRLAVQVTLIVLLVSLQSIILILEHNLCYSRVGHLYTLHGAHGSTQLLNGGMRVTSFS